MVSIFTRYEKVNAPLLGWYEEPASANRVSTPLGGDTWAGFEAGIGLEFIDLPQKYSPFGKARGIDSY
jgi:hypothetical protein